METGKQQEKCELNFSTHVLRAKFSLYFYFI